MTDEEFVHAFIGGLLSPADFDHRGHLRVAWQLVRSLPLEAALSMTCRGIERTAIRFGARDKYNRTMSEALVRLIADAQRRTPDATFDDFLSAHPILFQVRELLSRYYTPERLQSQEAKQSFVLPDLEPLP